MEKPNKTEILDSEIAHLLFKQRKSKNLTVNELAKRSGVSQAMISKVERGVSSPSANILSRLTSALGITLSQLFLELESTQNSNVLISKQQYWLDKNSGIIRWQLSPNGAKQELIKVELPPLGKLLIPSNALEGLIGQTLWVLSGKLDFQVNTVNYSLVEGDCIALNTAADCNLTNPDAEHASVYVAAFAQK
ncbi:helix-turn-helix transcriptional regulator [Providencia sp.]